MKYIEEYKKYLDEQLLGIPEVNEGKMFGYPAYYINGKLAICHYEDNLIIKLPAERVTQLVETDLNASREGPKPRRNMGKEWIFLHIPDINYVKNKKELFMESIEFTNKIRKQNDS